MGYLRALARRAWAWPVWCQVAGAVLVAFGVGALAGGAVGLIVAGVELIAGGTLAEASAAAAKAAEVQRRRAARLREVI